MIGYLLELGTSWTTKPVMLWQGREWISFMIIGSFMWGSFTIVWELTIIRIIEITNNLKIKIKNKKRRNKINGSYYQKRRKVKVY